ncbi:MAG TPA: hypothetical protein VM933_06100, partial [Acidimicrobiales bacterium]|nr:hypothetical protein [Acidimicrobiales bacterium]
DPGTPGWSPDGTWGPERVGGELAAGTLRVPQPVGRAVPAALPALAGLALLVDLGFLARRRRLDG